MKVKCIKVSLDDELLSNNDAVGLLEIGEEYFVSGISINILNSNLLYYEINIPISLILSFPSTMFEVVNNTVPAIWRVKLFNNGDLLIGPELFFEEYFFDRFSDQCDYETQEYEKIRPLLEV